MTTLETTIADIQTALEALGGTMSVGPVAQLPLKPVDASQPDNGANWSAEKYPNEDKWYVMRFSNGQQAPEVANEDSAAVLAELQGIQSTGQITIHGLDFEPRNQGA